MAASSAFASTISVNTGSFVTGTLPGAATWSKMASIMDISGPELSTNDIDVTTNDSSDATKEYIAGLIEPGEVSFDINYDPSVSSHDRGETNSFPSLLLSRAVKNWRIQIAGSTSNVIYLNGYVKQFGIDLPMEEQVKASVTIKVTGSITLP